MRPFQEFRLWAKRAPGGERVATGIAAVIVIGLLGWLLVPGSDEGAEVAAVGGAPGVQTSQGGAAGAAAPGVPGAVGSDVGGGAPVDSLGGGAPDPGAPAADGAVGTAATGGGDPAAGAAEGGGAGTPAAAAGQTCVSGTAKGLTDKEVKVVVALTEIVGPAANSIFDIPTPAEAKADFEAAIKGINGEGGIACRTLVAQYVNVNPTDEAGMMQQCRNFASMDVYAVVDTGSMATRPAVLACLGQIKKPYFGAFYITETLRKQFYPYIYSFYYKEQVYKDTAVALKEQGFFDPAKGFGKLGFLYRDCEKDAINAFRGWLREAGVGDAKVVPYSLGCPAVFASETDMAQATQTFRTQGVTHVIGANVQGDIARITAHFEQQRFRPTWGVPDEAMLSIASGSRAPNPDNFDGAIAVTLARDGEENTPGMSPTPGTQQCNAYRQAAGLPPVWDVPANAGHACSQLWMLRQALGNAPEVSAEGLQAGLQRSQGLDFSYPQGVADFTPPGTTTGGQHFRVAQYAKDCTCWRVVQQEFRRGF